MRRLAHLLLLWGALVGLLGQPAVFAAVPERVSAPAVAVSGMSADCMEMMKQPQAPAEQPCKGMTLDCVIAMGCAMPITFAAPASPVAVPLAVAVRAVWPESPILAGRAVAPETHPPTVLG